MVIELYNTSDSVTMALMSSYLLRGKVKDAEALIPSLNDKAAGEKRIADWKVKYAGMPHGQWEG